MTTLRSYSIVHHVSGDEYVARFDQGDVDQGYGPLSQHEVASIMTEADAQAVLDNQDAETLAITASDLCTWIEARDAWIVRGALDPNLR